MGPSNMRRMRTASGVLDIIRAGDPETAVSLRYIRRLINTGEVPVARVGRKMLVDADRVIAYIADGTQSTPQVCGTGEIRRVPV